METIKLKDVKKGEYFKRKADAKKVFIRGDYVREDKKFECQNFDDINHFVYLKGDTLVFVGFEF